MIQVLAKPTVYGVRSGLVAPVVSNVAIEELGSSRLSKRIMIGVSPPLCGCIMLNFLHTATSPAPATERMAMCPNGKRPPPI